MSTAVMRPVRRRPGHALARGLALLAAASLLLTACNRTGQESASPEQKATGQGLVIGWSQRGIAGSDWYKTLVAGGEAEAAEIGAQIQILDANRETTRQNEDVQTLISRGVDVVIMNANDPLGVASSVKALKDAGIPLVTVNSNLDPSLVPDMYCYVAEDQVATGALAGEAIAQDAIAKWGTSGEIKLVGIGGLPGDVISELRYQGFMQGYDSVMAQHPEITTTELPFKYGEWLPDQALTPIRDVATANPDLKIVYSESDVMQAGIQQGLQQAGLWGPGILEASYDGGMNAVKEMLDNPDGPLQATASNQPWDQGALAVQMAVAAFNGDPSACPDKTEYVETTVVTPENAADYYKPEDTYVRAQENS
ncbi:sugar ABC transporter substrate-binding protein [Pseudonocardia kunmingensis]|uniref:Monosaccharide ABC transporter substrate-binding protein (CUT2 family) n=1 Tax=Pseudonocardia kunmingensis TaxID=630975 RepID=A0A543DVF8_9PSEU|nr:substrate-binding domain-containing protein [Pseudonocardia kunmingensis]TQM13310.1 monosaccharide ABC transporter substrate-binding protein (CUT2 family) [Pseudonocardia kunmingensis]